LGRAGLYNSEKSSGRAQKLLGRAGLFSHWAGPVFLCSVPGQAGLDIFGPGQAGLDIFGPCRALVETNLIPGENMKFHRAL